MYKNHVKRVLDICLSLMLLLILSPLLLFISLLIKLDSKGEVLFRQTRIGLNAKTFEIYKFRSMCVGAENMGTGQYSFAGDPSVTKVGKILRATSLDELPQLINILKGDMSFIGPRPPLTYHPWELSEYTPEQLRMFEVRPGMTGWAQVNGRKEVEWHERIRLNVEYVDNCSFAFDIKIFFKTIFQVLKNEDNLNHGETVIKDEKEESVTTDA